ncbi:YdcF family protein [Candidatus Uhrbacteria bacterium]|nr:YdcF family protein [Candidatus Uhrbacteria bacterium]
MPLNMFTFLKLLRPFLLPPTLLAAAFAIGCVLVWRNRKRSGLRILLGALVVYVLLSLDPIANGLAWTLERSYVMPPSLDAHRDAAAIVILAGGAAEADERRDVGELSGASWRRLWRGISVYHALGGSVPIIYSGGSGDPFNAVSHEAELARSYATAAGIPADSFMIETASRTTHENGSAVVRLLWERRPEMVSPKVLLVTSAWHMRRAVAVFEGLGVAIVPIPADFAARTPRVTPLSFFPSADSFSSSVTSIHEWVGIAGYRLLGRI